MSDSEHESHKGRMDRRWVQIGGGLRVSVEVVLAVGGGVAGMGVACHLQRVLIAIDDEI
jgi:hypothetical protein